MGHDDDTQDDDNSPNGQEAEDYAYEKYRQARVDAGTWRPEQPVTYAPENQSPRS